MSYDFININQNIAKRKTEILHTLEIPEVQRIFNKN